MSKEIDINNEEEILKECDFDYFYESENCSHELCMFYNDIQHQNADFNCKQAHIDLGRIAITLNKQGQRIAELEEQLAESEKLKENYDILRCQHKSLDESCDELKQQLKEKDNEHAKEMMAFEKKCQAYYNSKGFAIEQLEKVKARFNGKRPIDEMANDVGVELGYTATQIQNYIANLQDQLKTLTKNEKVFSRGEEE